MSSILFSKDEFLKAAKKVKAFTKGKDFDPGAEVFVADFYDDAVQNEALTYSIEELLKLGGEFWMFGQTRTPGEILIQTEKVAKSPTNPATHVIKMICDDRRFLVDSVVNEVASHGIDVLGLYHPIVPGARTAEGRWVEDKDANASSHVSESMIMIIIPAQTAANMRKVKTGIENTMTAVRLANEDFPKMLAQIETSIEQLEKQHGLASHEDISESLEFLRWLRDGNFVFLGARSYDFVGKDKKSGPKYDSPVVVKGSQLGVLSDPGKHVLRRSNEPSTLVQDIKSMIASAAPVSIAKSNLQSRVHRRVRMDFVSVLIFDAKGVVTGETRYVGLFTVEAYALPPKTVPLVRRKVENVLKRANLGAGTHNHKRLNYVLSTYPRDELFQSSEDELLRISTGAAQAYDRPRPRLFVRRDPFNRFVSVLVYIPREQYSTLKRQQIGKHLKDAFEGRISAFYPQYSDSPLARVLYIVGMDRGNTANPDLDDLEAEITAVVQPWESGLQIAAEARDNTELQNALGNYYQAFDGSYRQHFDLDDALDDIGKIEALTSDEPVTARIYKKSDARKGESPNVLRVKFYRLKNRLELSDIMPMFGNMGLHVAQETGYEVNRRDGTSVWIHNYEMRMNDSLPGVEGFQEGLENAFLATWFGRNEDDGFNTLILAQRADWRRVAFLRLLARYRQQSGMDPAESVQIEALLRYPDMAKILMEMIDVRFNPESFKSMEKRRKAFDEIHTAAKEALDAVVSLTHDKALRGMVDTLAAGLRTNFFQTTDKGQHLPYISLKIASPDIDALPLPKPYREIYVSSPQVEGVHLRFGPVARGGLRWSDRRDDFRTEVLGLVKAQQVKNAVIVPVGSKGGFYPKTLPADGDRDAVQAEAISAYTTFISGLLDVTDSYAEDGVRAPSNVVRWDKADPYLVVAADKGTATFSDVANGIARDYGFWLDDAFASGGSVGYDHKVMGITARGGWEAVKRHFREMGKDIQSEPFTAIGIGDMSGDVFGNGMLLSEQTQLIAAFDHRDIFIDPDPDVKKSFKERERLFKLDRSSWQDYNGKLISKGGGVFSRSEKSISLSDEMKAITGLSGDAATPQELMKSLLSAQTELLWFGGIGTYIKARSESNLDVGDKANDGIRINGIDLKAKVIGEGANLGVTQAGRIEFARKGGRLNTDAIDNAAGVDSSDNEVNIKILLREAIAQKEIKAKDRDSLLASMTDEVAALVLQHNYDQTLALSLAQSQGMANHDAYGRLMTYLTKHAGLNRAVEGLPTPSGMSELAAENMTLTRPEIAVLIAYTKNLLFNQLIDSDIAGDPLMDRMLIAYFPKPLRKLKKALAGHRLRREIIISRLANLIIDVGGPTFILRLVEHTNSPVADIAKAFIVAYDVLDIEELREQIAELDNVVDAKAQLSMHAEIMRVLSRVAGWMLKRSETGDLTDRTSRRENALKSIDADWLGLLSTFDQKRAEARIKTFCKAGVPKALAEDVSLLRSRATGFDVVELKEASGWPVRDVAELFYDMGGRFKIDRLRASILNMKAQSHWERLAIRHLQEDFYGAQARFSTLALNAHLEAGGSKKAKTSEIIAGWVKSHTNAVKTYDKAFTDMSRSGGWALPKFSIINAQLRDVAEE